MTQDKSALKTVGICSVCGLKYFEIPKDNKCNGSYEDGVCKGKITPVKEKELKDAS